MTTFFTKIRLNIHMTSYLIVIPLDIHCTTSFIKLHLNVHMIKKTLTRTAEVYHSSRITALQRQAVSEYHLTTTIHSDDSTMKCQSLTRTVQVYHSSQQLCSAKQAAKHVSSFLTTTMAQN